MDFHELFSITLLFAVVMLSASTFLPNLRRYVVVASVGRFAVPRDELEKVLKSRMTEDDQCGNCEYYIRTE